MYLLGAAPTKVVTSRGHRCSSVALLVLGVARNVRVAFVSQAITTVFHAPATVYVQSLHAPMDLT